MISAEWVMMNAHYIMCGGEVWVCDTQRDIGAKQNVTATHINSPLAFEMHFPMERGPIREESQ